MLYICINHAKLNVYLAQSAGTIEYTNCISAEGKTPPISVLDITLSNLMVRLWRMLSTPLLPSHPDPPWPKVLAPDRVLSMGKIELFDL